LTRVGPEKVGEGQGLPSDTGGGKAEAEAEAVGAGDWENGELEAGLWPPLRFRSVSLRS